MTHLIKFIVELIVLTALWAIARKQEEQGKDIQQFKDKKVSNEIERAINAIEDNAKLTNYNTDIIKVNNGFDTAFIPAPKNFKDKKAAEEKRMNINVGVKKNGSLHVVSPKIRKSNKSAK